MKTLIDFYIQSRQLIKPFRISRGEISAKNILIVVFDKSFAFELPLTPSNGEMPMEVLNQAKKGQASKMLRIAYSYYKGLINNQLHPIVPLEKFNTQTYGINDTDIINQDALQRFKCSPENIEYIINWTHNSNQSWAADFNQSLTSDQLDDFIARADLSRCVYIEQPTSGHHISTKYPVPIWIDEGLKDITPSDFPDSNFSGFMLKPLNYFHSELKEWISFAQTNNIPFFISGVVCDTLFYKFLEYLNQFATWQNCYSDRPNFLHNELSLKTNPYFSKDFSSTIKEIKNKYDHALTFECDIEIS